MLRTRIRTGVLISGGAVAALLLAGCDSGGGTANTGNPDVPSVPQSENTTTSPTTSPPAPPATTQAQQQPAPADGGECKVADLDLRLSEGEGTAGTTYRSLVFTNKGTRTCTIQGFPGVSFVAGDDGHQVGPAAYRVGEKGPVITLKPGDSAFSDIGFVQIQNYDPAECEPTEVRGLRVYPPHDYDSAFVPNPGTGCAGSPPGNQLTVATVQAGTGTA